MVTDQGAENEEDHEESSESRLAVDVAVADRRHGNEREVDAVPVRHRVRVAEVRKRITGVLHLTATYSFTVTKTEISCEDIARQSCAMVPRWRFLATFFGPAFAASRVQHISDLHSKFALGPCHV